MNPDLVRFLLRVTQDGTFRSDLGSGPMTPVRIIDFAARHGYRLDRNDLEMEDLPLGEFQWSAAERRYANTTGSREGKPFILFLEEAPMSKETIAAFFKKVAGDSALQKKFAEFAAEQGFEFSPDELSDVDLDSVAGGLGYIKIQDSSIKMD